MLFLYHSDKKKTHVSFKNAEVRKFNAAILYIHFWHLAENLDVFLFDIW